MTEILRDISNPIILGGECHLHLALGLWLVGIGYGLQLGVDEEKDDKCLGYFTFGARLGGIEYVLQAFYAVHR